jgi:hypothetical protein
MARDFGQKKRNILNKIRLALLYLTIRTRILLPGVLSPRKSQKKTFLVFFSLLTLTFPCTLLAEESVVPWPWIKQGEDFRITSDDGNDYGPSITANDKFYFVVWSRKGPKGYDIYGIRIDKTGKRMLRKDNGKDNDGNEMEQAEIPICTAQNDQLFPSASWNGENFLVVWQDKRSGVKWEIYGAWVTPEGQVLEPGNFKIASAKSNLDQTGAKLSFDGENHLVVWVGEKNAKTTNVYFAKVSRAGIVGRPTAVNASSRNQTAPAVVFNGEDYFYFIVWQDTRNGKFWDVYGVRVKAETGEVLDPTPIQITDTQKSPRWKPSVAWKENYYLVVWTVVDSDNPSISGRRVAASGDVLDLSDISIQGDGAGQVFPVIIWDESDFLMVWEERSEGEAKIMGVSIQPEYRVIISESEQISSETIESKSSFSFPEMARLGDDVLVVWQEGPNSEGVWNIFGQIIQKFNPETPVPTE